MKKIILILSLSIVSLAWSQEKEIPKVPENEPFIPPQEVHQGGEISSEEAVDAPEPNVQPQTTQTEGASPATSLPKEVPLDLLEDDHARQELGINEFTAPSIEKLFDTLQFLMPLPMTDTKRELSARMPLDRAELAMELGFLIADGFLVVESGQMSELETLAKDLTRYSKALGAGDRVNRHSASLLESAKNKEIEQLKKELAATQRDVESELIVLKDADLAHLISLGGWIRALEVSAAAVNKQFSPERGAKIMREDIADYYTEVISSLIPSISERDTYVEMRKILSGFRHEMVQIEGKEVTVEQVKLISEQSKRLAELALKRQP